MSKERSLIFILAFFFFSTPVSSQSFKEQHSFQLYADSLVNYSSLWIDLDQDYDYDLLNFSILNKPNNLRLNSNNLMVKTESVFAKDGGNANGACYADIDMDGDLDIFVYSIFGQKNYLYIQESKGVFRKDFSQVFTQIENNAFCASFSDVNLDSYPDLVITDTELWNPKSTKRATKIYLNNGKGNFTNSKPIVFPTEKSDTRSVLLSDFNQDGREDLLLLNFGSANELYLKNEGQLFNRANVSFTLSKGDYNDAKSIDFDNDGDLDLLISNLKTGIDVYRNEGHLLFTKVENVFNLNEVKITSIETCDWNNDGAMDVLLNESLSANRKLFINTKNEIHWIKFKLRADRANINAIQAKVYLKTMSNTNEYWQYKEVRAESGANLIGNFDVHFGLNKMTTVDSVRIVWADGTEQMLSNLNANEIYFVEQRMNAKKVNASDLRLNETQSIRDLSVKVVADNFRYGEVAGITAFYENKGLVEEDIEVKINLSVPMKLVNSFPMPNTYTNSEYTWIVKNVSAQYRGIITLSVNTPNIEETNIKQQEIRVEIEPVIGDENLENNVVKVIKPIK